MAPRWEAYRRPDPDVLVWKATSLEMNPGLDPAFIEKEYAKDEARARAEYGAEFRTDVESFIAQPAIEECLLDAREQGPLRERRYVAFVDLSGGSHDSFTLAIAHRDDKRASIDAIRERKPPFSPEGVVEEFCVLLKDYRVRTVVGDRYAGEWPREQFAKRGIKYKPSDLSKSELYLELLPAINSRRVELLEHSRLIGQLTALERRTSRGAQRRSLRTSKSAIMGGFAASRVEEDWSITSTIEPIAPNIRA